MTPHTIPQTVLFPDLFDKPPRRQVQPGTREFRRRTGVLLKAAERVYGLVKVFAGCLADKRAPGKIRHTLADLIGQRVFGIACGHPDGNDADPLGPTTPSTSCCSGATRCPARPWRRNPRSRDSRTARAPHRALPDGARVGGVRPSSVIGAACRGGRGASPSIWTRPTT